MVMRQRFTVWRIAHDLGNHSLSFDVREGVLEDDFHLLRILRKPGRNPECCRRQYEPKEALRIALIVLPSRCKCLLRTARATLRLLKGHGNIGGIVCSDALS
jgi:hypothetical protein